VFSLYGDCRGAIWSHRVQPSPAARQGANRQSRGVERAPIGSRAGLQMARITQAFRPLAHHLYPHEPLLQNGVWDRIFDPSQREQIVPMQITAVPPDSATVKVHPAGAGALNKRSPSHRQGARRRDPQDSSGCRQCSHGDTLRAFSRSSLRGQAGPPPVGRDRSAPGAPASHPGSRLRRQRNPATGAGFRLYPRGSSPVQPLGTAAIRQGP
jgi:hypothetical protein